MAEKKKGPTITLDRPIERYKQVEVWWERGTMRINRQIVKGTVIFIPSDGEFDVGQKEKK